MIDSLAAMLIVDKGRYFEDISLVSLRIILKLCDEKGILLVALWAPRELNQLTDYLSHLSMYLNRFSVEGRLGSLPIFSGVESAKGEQRIQGQAQEAAELRAVLSGAVHGALSSSLRSAGSLRLSACGEEQRLHSIAQRTDIGYHDRVPPISEVLWLR